MAKVLATNIRFVRVAKKGTGGAPDELERVRMLAGSSVNDLPKDVQKDLDEQGLLVDEERITAEGARIPPGFPDRKVEKPDSATSDDKK